MQRSKTLLLVVRSLVITLLLPTDLFIVKLLSFIMNNLTIDYRGGSAPRDWKLL